MHIAIEGCDGVGKTTAAKLLAARLGCPFVEKPLAMVTDPDGGYDQYLRFTRYINAHTDLAFRALIYGAGTYLLHQRAQTESLVTDRHLCSMYAINATAANHAFFDYLVQATGAPDLTVILYADGATRRARILGRDLEDPDLAKSFDDHAYKRMRAFVEYYQMPYLWLDTTHRTPEDIVAAILHRLADEQSGSRA